VGRSFGSIKPDDEYAEGMPFWKEVGKAAGTVNREIDRAAKKLPGQIDAAVTDFTTGRTAVQSGSSTPVIVTPPPTIVPPPAPVSLSTPTLVKDPE